VELCEEDEEDEEEESEGTLQRRVWQRELWAAAVEGDVETVRDRIVDKKVDVNTRCTEEYVDIMACNWRGINRTALHFACLSDEEYEGNQEVISLLIKLGADLSARTDEGDTPLHYACLHGNADVCIMLALAGADPTAKNYDMPMDPSDIGIFLRCTSPQTLNPKPQTPNPKPICMRQIPMDPSDIGIFLRCTPHEYKILDHKSHKYRDMARDLGQYKGMARGLGQYKDMARDLSP